jgi:hypothetical protein
MIVFPLKWFLAALPWILLVIGIGLLIMGENLFWGVVYVIGGGAWATYQVKKWRATRR